MASPWPTPDFNYVKVQAFASCNNPLSIPDLQVDLVNVFVGVCKTQRQDKSQKETGLNQKQWFSQNVVSSQKLAWMM